MVLMLRCCRGVQSIRPRWVGVNHRLLDGAEASCRFMQVAAGSLPTCASPRDASILQQVGETKGLTSPHGVWFVALM